MKTDLNRLYYHDYSLMTGVHVLRLVNMRLSCTVLIILLSFCSGCGRLVRLRHSDELGLSRQGIVIAETWQGDEFMSLPIWKICLRQHDNTNREVLFTVASVFQESQPGYPHLVVTNGIETVQDSAQSYIYSLSTRTFITNGWPGDTHVGDYKPKQ
jgi:hypothetical protein